MPGHPPPTPASQSAQLHAELPWLRALARRVAGDDEREDLVQQTLLIAHESGGGRQGWSRGWLAAVLRNQARARLRSDARRRSREAAVATRGPDTATDDQIHRQRVLHSIRDVFDGLERPDRDLLLARYYEGRSALSLAEELGLPPSTVRSRLSRATARMRQRLDERWGGTRSAWAPAVLAVPGRPASTGSASLGWLALSVGLMSKKFVLAVLVVVVGTAWWLGTRDEPSPSGPAASTRAAQGGSTAPERRTASRTSETAANSGSLTVDVLSAEGRPLVGATVLVASEHAAAGVVHRPGRPALSPHGLTDARGLHAFDALPFGRYRVTASLPGFHPGVMHHVELSSETETETITLRLEPGGNLVTGTVVDMGGGPIEGVLVHASDDGSFEAGAVTGPEGEYRLTLPDGAWSLRAGGVDYTADYRRVFVHQGAGRADFSLVPGSSIRGRVVARETGLVVPNATVSFTGYVRQGRSAVMSTASPEQEAVTDSRGRFELAPLPPGEYAVVASAEGLGTAADARVYVGIAEDADIVVPLDRAYRWRGRVVLADDPEVGIEGIDLTATGHMNGPRLYDRSRADGTAELVGLLPGRYILRMRGPSIVTPRNLGFEIIDADLLDQRVEVTTGVTLAGTVVPPEPAQITLRAAPPDGAGISGPGHRATVRAGKDGAFSIPNAPVGPVVIVAEGRSGALARQTVEVGPDGLVDYALTLRPRARVVGTVSDRGGDPLDGMRVTLLPAEPRDERLQTTTTDADGRFELLGVAPAQYSVVVADARDQNLQWPGLQTIDTTDGADIEGLEVTVDVPTERLTGLVVDPHGHPVADAWVTAQTRPPDTSGERWPSEALQVLTDSDGRFALERLDDATYVLTADAPDGQSRVLGVEARPGRSVRLTLHPLGSLTLWVTHRGEPVTDFTVMASTAASQRRVLDDQGRATLSRLEPGPLSLSVRAREGVAESKLETAQGEPATLRLELTPWGVVEGTVVVGDGDAPPAPVGVTVLPANGTMAHFEGFVRLTEGVADRHTDDAGRFRLDQVQPGTITLHFSDPETGQTLGTRSVEVEPGKTVDLGAVRL